MKDDIKNSKINILKTLISQSEISLDDGYLIQSTFRALDSDKKNIDPIESFTGAQALPHDNYILYCVKRHVEFDILVRIRY